MRYDSKSFVKRALKIVNQLRNGVDKPRRWKLVSDGDLWEHFYLAIKAKGPNAFWATWVKGHATEEHIQQEITTKKHKEGNHKADEIADLGASVYGKDLHDLATVYHHRHDRYFNIMKKLSPTSSKLTLLTRSLMKGGIMQRKQSQPKAMQSKNTNHSNTLIFRKPLRLAPLVLSNTTVS